MTNKKDALQRKARVRQYFAVFLVNLLGISMGITAGWTSPMQSLLTSADNPVGTEPISVDTFALLGSVSFISSGISVVFWSRIADWIGRKASLLLVTVPYIVSWIFTILAQNAVLLLVARFLTGLAIAGTVLIVPVYLVEIAENDLRGIFGSFLGLAINVGVLISFALGSYLGYYGLALLGLAVPVAFVFMFIWVPETPFFFWKKNKADKAEKSLLWYQGGDVIKTKQTLSEFKFIQDKESKSSSFKSLFATKGRRRSMFLGVSAIVAIQGSGVFPLFNFAESLFHMSGTSLTPNQSSVVIALMQLISSCFCSLLIERTGRKPLIVVSLMIMSTSLFTLGTHLYFVTSDTNYRWVPLVSLSVHVVAYSLGLGPVAFIVIAEIFPSEIRCFALSLMHLLNGSIAFLSVTLFPAMLKFFKPHGCFLLYSLSCLSFSLLFFFILPETKGKPEIEILKVLNDKQPSLEETSEISQPLSKDLHQVS